MPSNDYIPAEDALFRTYANTFASRLTSSYALYMLSAAEAASVQVAVDQFNAAYALAADEATRTKATIIQRDNARSVAESLIRQYAMLVKENDGIADEDKVILGVRPENTSRERIDPPATSPLLNILGNTPGSQTLRYADSSTPDSRKRPFGAAGLQLYLAIGTQEAAPLSAATLHSLATRNPISVEFGEADDGKIATYYARWYSVRGEVGPWSLPVSMRIAA